MSKLEGERLFLIIIGAELQVKLLHTNSIGCTGNVAVVVFVTSAGSTSVLATNKIRVIDQRYQNP